LENNKHWRFEKQKERCKGPYVDVVEMNPYYYQVISIYDNENRSYNYIDTELEGHLEERYPNHIVCCYTCDTNEFIRYDIYVDEPSSFSASIMLWKDEYHVSQVLPQDKNLLILDWMKIIKEKKGNRLYFITGTSKTITQ
jgi:hypothetical protein